MAGVTRADAEAQVRRTIGAYRDRVHEVRNDTDRLPPEGARIVDEYCSFDNDWQDLVQDAVREASFLGGMDDGLLLEYCAVCMELDGALGLDSWRIGRVDRIVQDDKGIWEAFWGALQGEFNENPSGKEILIDMGLNFIPFVGQACDARDIAACLKKLVLEKRADEAMIWATLLLTAVGCIPYAGDVVKAGCKAILKGADDIVLEVLRKLDAEDVYRAFKIFKTKFTSCIDDAIAMVSKWIEEAGKSKYASKINSIFARAGENLRKAVEFMKERIDEFGDRVFKKGKREAIKFMNIPKSNGFWSGMAGNSKWIPDDDFIPLNPKTNPNNLSWKQIKSKYGINEIPFHNGEPDFNKVSKGKVKIAEFVCDRDANFDMADELLAKIKHCEPEDVQKWRRRHKYTWHECKDCSTLLKVPTEVHGNIPHVGGISEIKKI